MLQPQPPTGAAVLVTGVDGPLARAIARRLAADCPALALAAPDLRAARAAAAEVERLRALHRCPGTAHAFAADPARPGGAASALAAARAAIGPLDFVVACAPLGFGGAGDGAPAPAVGPFERVLDGVAALPAGERPRAVVLAARSSPPLYAGDAREALEDLARRTPGLDGTAVHVVTVVDPHAAAAARAFGLMDRPFGVDVELALRQLERAVDAVRAIVIEKPAAV